MIINSNDNTMIINRPELVSTPISTESGKSQRKSVTIKHQQQQQQNEQKETQLQKPGRTKSPTKLPNKNPSTPLSTELPPISTSSSKKY